MKDKKELGRKKKKDRSVWKTTITRFCVLKMRAIFRKNSSANPSPSHNSHRSYRLRYRRLLHLSVALYQSEIFFVKGFNDEPVLVTLMSTKHVQIIEAKLDKKEILEENEKGRKKRRKKTNFSSFLSWELCVFFLHLLELNTCPSLDSLWSYPYAYWPFYEQILVSGYSAHLFLLYSMMFQCKIWEK